MGASGWRGQETDLQQGGWKHEELLVPALSPDRAHTSNNLTTTRVLLYPASISALSLVQAVCQTLICVQVPIVFVQEKVIVLRERVTLGVVGRWSVWSLVSWRRWSGGWFQEFLDWRVIKNCRITWPGPLQQRGQTDPSLFPCSPDKNKAVPAAEQKVNVWRKSKYLTSCLAEKHMPQKTKA